MKKLIGVLLLLAVLFAAYPITVFAGTVTETAAEQTGETDASEAVTLYRYRKKLYTGRPIQESDSSWILYKTEPYSDYCLREKGYSSDHYVVDNMWNITYERVQYYKELYSSWDSNLVIDVEYNCKGYAYNTQYDGSGRDRVFPYELTIPYQDYYGRTYYEYEGSKYYYQGRCDLYTFSAYSEYYYYYYKWDTWSDWSETPVEATDERQVETKPGKRITYNANGGVGAPSYIAVGLDDSFTVSADMPSRVGHQFLGWAISASGEAVYQPGDTCAVSDVTTLYAVWQFTGMISVETMPNKVQYGIGESLDASGLAILLSAADGSKTVITEGYTVSDLDSSTLGHKTVTVSYGGYTTTFDVLVADTGFCGGDLAWTYDGEGTLTISGTGAMGNYSGTDVPWLNYREEITAVLVEPGLTRIGSYAFYSCSSLTDVTIPDTVTAIGSSAFDGCSSLTNVAIPNTVTKIENYTFSGCSSLTNITIPNRVTAIGSNAFYGCSSLADLTIPDSVITIEYGAFKGCSGLKDVTIGSGVTSFGSSVFYGCSSLERMTIPFVGEKRVSESDYYQYPFGYLFGTSSFTGTYAAEQEYYGYASVTSKTYQIPSSLTSVTVTGGYIPHGAFSNCRKITDITVGSGVTKIGSEVFYNCAALVRISISSGVTEIGTDAFYNCSYLKNVYITDIKAWCETVFSNRYANPLCYADYLYVNGKLITDLTIPAGTATIGNYAFVNYGNLATVGIPDSVTSIGGSAFSGCSGLVGVTYCGTESQWGQITIGTSNSPVTSASRYYHSWQAATCDTPGMCKLCGARSGEALGHVWQAATCTAPKTCTVCGRTEGAPAEHSGSWMLLIDPTCTQTGLKARICEVCGVTESNKIPALGHQGEKTVVPPTCTTDGYTTVCCTVCGQTATENIVSALGHSYEAAVTQPTCTEQGYTTHTCSTCGDAYVDTYVDATGHKWSAWISVSAASCKAEGSQIRFCSCGTRETEILEKLPHNYVDEVCTACGKNQFFRMALTADTQVSLNLEQDLYVDLCGFDLSGTIITNGYKIYGMDSTTDSFSCSNIGYFTCVDTSGNYIVPERIYAEGATRYMAICTEDRYSFHRFFVGVTHMSLDPEVVGLGYKSAVFCDEMVLAELAKTDTLAFRVQLEGYDPVYRYFDGNELLPGDPISLRIRNYDVENYSEHNLYAQVSLTLNDGTVIETEQISLTFRWLTEQVDANYTDYTAEQLAAFRTMLQKFPVTQKWDIPNIVTEPKRKK